jgi:flavin-dependent dehydrogenase
MTTDHHDGRYGERHDVVVVGARVAGAATAMLLARRGFDVAVLDRAAFPSDALSTHAIARGGVVQLARWGLLDAVLASGAPKIRRVAFHLPGGETDDRMIKERYGLDHLVAPRRHILDALLQKAAVDAGADVRTGVTVHGVVTDGEGRVSGVTVTDGTTGDGAVRTIGAALVIGADGVHSRIARAVDAAVVDQRPSDGAGQYTYVTGFAPDAFEFHVADGLFAGVFPTHGGEANVWVCSPADVSVLSGRGDERIAKFLDLLDAASPSLAERVRSAEITAPVRGAARYPNHVRQAFGPGWALVGDAGYHRDPVTGHGITDAFRDAELLATHVDDLRAYAEERDRALAPIFDLTCRLGSYPPVDEFVALQKQLSVLLEREADALASRPPVPAAGVLAA